MNTPTRTLSSLPQGTAFSRYLMCLGASHGDSGTAVVMAERFRDSPQVAATLDLRLKSAIAPGTTTDSTFGAPLAQHGIASEALTLLRGTSILGALEGRFRRVPFRASVPRETGTGTGGAWVGEGVSTPVAATSFDLLSQEVYKAQTMVVLTRELLRIGDSAAEKCVRDTTVAGVSAYVDQQFLLPTVTGIANVRPAAITNGATEVTSSGTSAANIATDLEALLAAITTPGGGLVWIMRPTTAYRIAAKLGAAAADVPRTLLGIPLVLSKNSPQQITLLDAGEILYSDDGAIDIATSEQALIQMNTTPTDPPVAATVFQSLWDANLWAIKVTRWLAYQRAQSGAVAFMTVSY